MPQPRGNLIRMRTLRLRESQPWEQSHTGSAREQSSGATFHSPLQVGLLCSQPFWMEVLSTGETRLQFLVRTVRGDSNLGSWNVGRATGIGSWTGCQKCAAGWLRPGRSRVGVQTWQSIQEGPAPSCQKNNLGPFIFFKASSFSGGTCWTSLLFLPSLACRGPQSTY